MIDLMEAIIWLEGIKANNPESKQMDISDVELMLYRFDQDAEVTIEDVVMWHPEERYIRVKSEHLNEFNEDEDEEIKTIELHFNSTDAMETMHLALGSLLRRHYETQLDKMK